MGAPGNYEAGNDGGAAYLLYGPIPAGTYSLSTYDAKMYGLEDNYPTGLAVTSGGDVDGDGCDEMIVDDTWHAIGPGTVYVFLGGPRPAGGGDQ